MKTTCYLIVLAPFFVLLAACEKVIEAKDLPAQDPLLVVNSLLCKDSMITAHVSQSKSILSNKEYKYITNAVCALYENDMFVQNLVHTANGSYYAPVTAQANRRYALKITSTGFETAEATTEVPESVVVLSVENLDTAMNYKRERTSAGNDNTISGEVKFKLRLRDNSPAENYYAVEPRFLFLDAQGTPVPYTPTITVADYGSTTGLSGVSYVTGMLIFDDLTLVNGSDIIRTVGIQLSLPEEAAKPLVKTVKLSLRFVQLSPDYFRYIKTAKQQAATRANIFAEPVQVYNNIKKGLGIFGAESSSLVPVYGSSVR